jgi:hypothetical protein
MNAIFPNCKLYMRRSHCFNKDYTWSRFCVKNYFDSISLNKPVDLGVFSVLENVSKFTNFPFLHQIVFS